MAGVAPVKELDKATSRLVPDLGEGTSPLTLDKEKRLVKLAELRVE